MIPTRAAGRGVHTGAFRPGAAQLRGRRWRAARTDADVFVRTYRDADDEIPDAYQAFIALHEFPRQRHRLA
jgi:hypothetical protein